MEEHRHTVLIVDDADDLREAFELFLRREGCNAASAPDAETALAVLRAGLEPCLVFVDIRLPRANGWQLLDAMRADPDPVLATIPVVILTGDPRHLHRATNAGMVALVKPIALDQLKPLVERHCRCAH